MLSATTIVAGLRFLVCLVMVFGLLAVSEGIMEGSSIRVLFINVPLWSLGLLIAGVGYRYWTRLPQVEAKLAALPVSGRDSAGIGGPGK